ncbi:MAG: hypothetical protein RIQ99_1260 [Pseudomonadota bacterium]
MSVTGDGDGPPIKVGIPTSDLSTGLYAAIAVLAAIHHRDRTGEGQHIDLALLDAQMALLANQASSFLNGGPEPHRMGNQHPTMVPYQDFVCADGEILVALGNDRQFRDFCAVLGLGELAADPRFASSASRAAHRAELLGALCPAVAQWSSADLLAAMDAAKLPSGKVNTIPEALANPQIAARGIVREIARDDGTPVRFIGFPAQFSATPATYRHAPPRAAQDTHAVLCEQLGLDEAEFAHLLASGVIAEHL